MTGEADFLGQLRTLATHPAARGLRDDAAVLAVEAGGLVLTHDMLVEGVHYLAGDPPGDVAWKLLAVNLSDLAAKGARPIGVLLGFALGETEWDAAFVRGLGEALAAFDVALLGGDTVAMPAGAPRALGLTAIGQAPAGGAPARDGARAGDALWVTGTIGDAGLGLTIALEPSASPAKAGARPWTQPASRSRGKTGVLDWAPASAGEQALLAAYRRPQPRLAAGQALAPHVHAMTDVSDGLLIDARNIAEASGLALAIDLDAAPLSAAFRAMSGEDRAARLAAATAGDDYQLLFAAPPDAPLGALSLDIARIGAFAEGSGLTLFDHDGAAPPPPRLGYRHAAPPRPAC